MRYHAAPSVALHSCSRSRCSGSLAVEAQTTSRSRFRPSRRRGRRAGRPRAGLGRRRGLRRRSRPPCIASWGASNVPAPQQREGVSHAMARTPPHLGCARARRKRSPTLRPPDAALYSTLIGDERKRAGCVLAVSRGGASSCRCNHSREQPRLAHPSRPDGRWRTRRDMAMSGVPGGGTEVRVATVTHRAEFWEFHYGPYARPGNETARAPKRDRAPRGAACDRAEFREDCRVFRRSYTSWTCSQCEACCADGDLR